MHARAHARAHAHTHTHETRASARTHTHTHTRPTKSSRLRAVFACARRVQCRVTSRQLPHHFTPPYSTLLFRRLFSCVNGARAGEEHARGDQADDVTAARLFSRIPSAQRVGKRKRQRCSARFCTIRLGEATAVQKTNAPCALER
eukprot:6189109-Pleurochrysis_carterae.AAC.5